MSEPPLTADPNAPVSAGRPAPLVGGKVAGVALLFSGLVIVGVAVALRVVVSGGGSGSGLEGEGLMTGLFLLSPLLYFVFFNPYVLVAYAALMVVLGVAVLRGSRRSLLAAVWIVMIEAVPSFLLLPMYGILGFPSMLARAVLAAILIVTLRRQPASPPAMWPGPVDQRPAATQRTGGMVNGLVVAAAAGLALSISFMAGRFLVFEVMDVPVLGPIAAWWIMTHGPMAIVAFALGWFAGSGRAAMLHGTVAAGVCAVLAVFVWNYGMFQEVLALRLIGYPVGGVVLGWLGHLGRGHRVHSLVAALSLPALLALDQILFPVVWTGTHVPEPGTPVLLAADAVLAVVLVLRFLRARSRRQPVPEL